MAIKQLTSKGNSPEDEELKKFVEKAKIKIKVVGCGGAGNNTVSRLMQMGIKNVETIAINTDALDLLYTDANKKILIGKETTRGLGAGADISVGKKAAEEQRDEIKNAIKGADLLFLTAGLGGGCLRGSSLVYTNPDGPVRIDSIKPGSFVFSLENGKLVKRRVLAAMRTGIKKVLEVKTNNNTIYASYDHPFLKVVPLKQDKRGRFYKFRLEWTPAQSLKVGDLVVILREVPEYYSNYQIFRNFTITKEFCRLFGFLLGDGWISRSSKSWKVFFSPSKYEKLNKKYISLMEKVLNVKMKKGSNWYYCNSKRAYEILERAGLKKRAREKEIPYWIFRLPKSFQKEFILGLADADGCYYKQKEKKKIELRFEMGSEKLIRQLKVLCNYLGLRTSNISCRTRGLKPPHSKQKMKITTWNLRVYKLYQLDENLEDWTRERKGIGFLYGYRGSTNLDFFKYFGFARIKSIEEIGDEEVYDIVVEGSHNFVAEGFVVHNSGSASLPLVAQLAKEMNILTIAVVTLPFLMEGRHRAENARIALEELEQYVDTLIVIQNEKLLEIAPNLTLAEAFKFADEILANAVKGIVDVVMNPGLVNVDFADLKAIIKEGKFGVIGMGESDTEKRAIEAAEKAISHPLLNIEISNGKAALIDIMSDPSITVKESQKVIETVASRLSEDAKIIWGVQIDKNLNGKLKTLVVITGLEKPEYFKIKGFKKKKEIEKYLGVEFAE